MQFILLIAFILTLAGCANTPIADSRPETKTLKEEPLRRYELKGEVQRIDTQGKVPLVKIKHEALGDWMGPMTMDFPVKDPAAVEQYLASLRKAGLK